MPSHYYDTNSVDKKFKGRLTSTFFITLCLNLTGCGTIFSGTHQDIPISIAPTGTEVTVYRWTGEVVAGPQSSPGEVTVDRPRKGQRSYLVRASKDGYCPKYWLTNTGSTPAAWTYIWTLAIPIVDIIGAVNLLVDDATGGCCTVEPKSLDGALVKEAECAL